MTDYEIMAKEMDKYADFLAAHFRAIDLNPPRGEVVAVMNQYALLIQVSRNARAKGELTSRLTSRGMSVYDEETVSAGREKPEWVI